MKKSFVLFLIICMVVCLSGCYHVETTDTEQYNDFYQYMQAKNTSIGNNLPEPSDAFTVEDAYLYYSDWDLLDSMYTVYVNCVYTTEYYEQAKDEAYAISRMWGDPVSNSSSFDCESVVAPPYNEIYSGGERHGTYILFDDAERRIVYVKVFDDAVKAKSKNIPEEYLPKEWREISS